MLGSLLVILKPCLFDADILFIDHANGGRLGGAGATISEKII